MTYRTAGEALEKYKAEMGDELGNVFHYLLQDTYYVSSIWDQYETLFEHPDRIHLLNESGGYFFGNIQRIFFDYTLLGICRLTDPVKTGKHENLTIQRLTSLVAGPVRPELDRLLTIAHEKSAFCRDWRNRRIAHNDLSTKLEAGSPLAAATRRNVTDALVSIHDVLRLLALKYCDTNLGFVDIGGDDAIQLLYRLFFGKRYSDAQIERLKQGAPDHADFGVPDWLDNDRRYNRYEKER